MAVGPTVSPSPARPDPTHVVDRGAPLHGEPIVHFEKSPGRVEVELEDPGSLFDRAAPPTYPHLGPMLNSTVAKFMVDSAREDRRRREIGVTVSFRSSPLRPEEEAGARAQMKNFFTNEAEMAAMDHRVNSTEAWGSLRFALPVVVVAALIAGLLTVPSKWGVPVYLAELAYLLVVVVIWVMVWDPIEKLLFDAYFIRLRIRALHKLAKAEITFAYRPGTPATAGPAPSEKSPSESIRNFLEG
jgi:hypothetical protein